MRKTTTALAAAATLLACTPAAATAATATDPASKGARYGSAIIGDKSPAQTVYVGDSMLTTAGIVGATSDSCKRGAADIGHYVLHNLRPGTPIVDAPCWGATVAQVKAQIPAAIKGKSVRAVVVYAGVNDGHFVKTMTVCASGLHRACDIDITYAAKVFASKSFKQSLVALYKTAHVSGARLIIPAYPAMVKPGLHCTVMGDVTTGEQSRINAAEAVLNASIKWAAAQVKGATYVTVPGFAGHELCTAHTYWTGVNLRDAKSSMHPNTAGHATLATRLYKAGA